jgi:hypothetical protein
MQRNVSKDALLCDIDRETKGRGAKSTAGGGVVDTEEKFM